MKKTWIFAYKAIGTVGGIIGIIAFILVTNSTEPNRRVGRLDGGSSLPSVLLPAVQDAVGARSPSALQPAASDFFSHTRWMLVTAYCPCEICCGKWASVPMAERRLASGRLLEPLLDAKFVAAPPGIPFGTEIAIPGYADGPFPQIVPVLDRGGDIKGDRLDLFVRHHDEAIALGKEWKLVTFYEFSKQVAG